MRRRRLILVSLGNAGVLAVVGAALFAIARRREVERREAERALEDAWGAPLKNTDPTAPAEWRFPDYQFEVLGGDGSVCAIGNGDTLFAGGRLAARPCAKVEPFEHYLIRPYRGDP